MNDWRTHEEIVADEMRRDWRFRWLWRLSWPYRRLSIALLRRHTTTNKGGPMSLATISYQPEAHDSALDAYGRIKGYTVTVVVNDDDQFDAELVNATFHNGDLIIIVAPWNDEHGFGDRDKLRSFRAYDLARIEVM